MEYLRIIYDQFLLGDLEMYLRIFISTLIGLFIGWDRSSHNKPAGIKTYTYVSVSCTLITILSIDSANLFSEVDSGKMMDPMRLTAQVISGLGFLGAGLIMKDGLQVKGLTSAAMIFFAGGVGIGIGVGLYGLVLFSILMTFSSTKIENIYKKRELAKKDKEPIINLREREIP